MKIRGPFQISVGRVGEVAGYLGLPLPCASPTALGGGLLYLAC